jgi:hypothetical protein
MDNVVTVDSNGFEGRRAVRYIGQYKPIRPYPLANGLVILPAECGMIPYVSGSQVRMNISYLVGPNDLSDAALTAAYREWLAFDAFVLYDQYPMFYFDEYMVGEVDTVPAAVPRQAPSPDYKQIDYEDIAKVMLMDESQPAGIPRASYSRLFAAYQGLCSDLREMVEWSVSLPFRSRPRSNSLGYWELLHKTILLDRLIGSPPNCPQSPGTCTACGFPPLPHHAVRRRDWTREVLANRIDDDEVVEEYARVIDIGVGVRNRIAHNPLFDRSAYPELSPGERQTYGVDRAIEEFKHDAVALQSLLISLKVIARYLLLDRAFGTRHFRRLQPLHVARVDGNNPTD